MWSRVQHLIAMACYLVCMTYVSSNAQVTTMHQEVSYWIGENFERHDDVKQNQLVAGLSSGHPSGHMHLGKITLTGLSGLMQNSYI